MRKTIAAALICVAALAVDIVPAGALSGPVQVTRISLPCENGHTAGANVTATYRLHVRGVDRWGTVTLKASNGNSVHYTVFFQQYLYREIGTEVLNGDPLFPGDWFYIVGQANLSPGGYLEEIPPGAIDICQVLGADTA